MKIDEQTTIPLFAVLTSSVVLVGVVAWLTTIFVMAADAQAMNHIQEQKLDSQKTLLIDIRERLVRIEEKLKNQRGE